MTDFCLCHLHRQPDLRTDAAEDITVPGLRPLHRQQFLAALLVNRACYLPLEIRTDRGSHGLAVKFDQRAAVLLHIPGGGAKNAVFPAAAHEDALLGAGQAGRDQRIRAGDEPVLAVHRILHRPPRPAAVRRGIERDDIDGVPAGPDQVGEVHRVLGLLRFSQGPVHRCDHLRQHRG